MKTNVLDTYNLYVSLKCHFNTKRFRHRLNSPNKLTMESLLKRNDHKAFYQLSTLIKRRQVLESFMISCFLHDKNYWIGDLVEPTLVDIHKERILRLKNLPQTVQTELEEIKGNLKDYLTVDGSCPTICTVGASNETLAVLHHMTRFADNEFSIDPLWEETRFKIQKYYYLIVRKIEKSEDEIQEFLSDINRTVF